MTDLIAALLIFQKYKDVPWPTHCEHDVLMIMAVTKDEVSPEDATELTRLGFVWSDGDDGAWVSFRFGSA